jgi:signal transduction histidine kinase
LRPHVKERHVEPTRPCTKWGGDDVEPLATSECPSLEREREFERRLRRAAMDEAQRLAAELHDGVGQDLAGISLILSAMRQSCHAQHPDISEPLRSAYGLILQAMVNCGRVSEGFGGFLVRQRGLTAALRHFASQFDGDGINVEFRGKDIPASWLDEPTAYYLFGIGREAIVNAFRHSHAKTIRVACDHIDDTIYLIIEDDGVGRPDASNNDGGMGRHIMEYRARNIGAELTFVAVPTGGLRVECRMAYSPDDN